jgi:protein phosphatase-4 regulatory subunit 3
LSVKDEFYHRHIIQHNLFAPVFESFRSNPVGDNLLSSAVIEMCDFIRSQNIKSLIEYIVTQHVLRPGSGKKSLEELSGPYVNTLSVLCQAYDENVKSERRFQAPENDSSIDLPVESRYFHDLESSKRNESNPLNEKAREDQVSLLEFALESATTVMPLFSIIFPQRKFKEVDQEASYFEDDDDEGNSEAATDPTTSLSKSDHELHRTPRMFSLAQAPVLQNDVNLSEESADADDNQHAIIRKF